MTSIWGINPGHFEEAGIFYIDILVILIVIIPIILVILLLIMVMIILMITCRYLHISSIGTVCPLVLWDAPSSRKKPKS